MSLKLSFPSDLRQSNFILDMLSVIVITAFVCFPQYPETNSGIVKRFIQKTAWPVTKIITRRVLSCSINTLQSVGSQLTFQKNTLFSCLAYTFDSEDGGDLFD
jgi:hypothetical protein